MGRPLVLGRSQLSGKEENLGTDSGKNIDLELMFVELTVCVGHSLHSVLPLNVVTLDKFYNSLEEVRIRINNPYFNSVVKMK